MGLEKSYEILCKAFDHEAKVILEVQTITLFSMNNNVVILKIHYFQDRKRSFLPDIVFDISCMLRKF